MLDIKILLKVLNPEYTVRYFYMLLAAAFIPFLDMILVLMASRFLGEYLFLAVLAALSLIGFFISVALLKKNLGIIRTNTENNYYSEYYYNMIPATFLVAFLLIMPGVLGTVIGLIMTLPYLRHAAGSLITGYLKIEWKEIHEFLNVID